MKTILIFTAVVAMATEKRGVTPESPVLQRTLYMEPTKAVPGPEKNYTGIRLRKDSLVLIYYHEQTIAVVEVAKNRQLFNCELLEVRTKIDKKVALANLKTAIPNQIRINFPNMIDLMMQCQKLDFPQSLDNRFINEKWRQNKQFNPKELKTILSGVFPGTKWCGAGDLAGSYYDLGTDKQLDKCCRTHDLCPVKIHGFKTQYNITNFALFTKSHCKCDDNFYDCLKNVSTTTSDLLGNIYFNLGQSYCIEEIKPPNIVTTSSMRLVSRNKRY